VLALWDVETQKLKWRAKVPDPDFLGLKPKPNVSSLAFLDTGDDRKVLVGGPGQVGTSNHTVMLFDTSAGMRPVQQMNFSEGTVTALAPNPMGTGAYVGDARGKLAFLDFKKFQINGVLKGSASSIRSIVHHPTLPLIASTGLDRFVRFHETSKRTLVHSVYLKQVGYAVAFDLTEVEQAPKEDGAAPKGDDVPRKSKKNRKADVTNRDENTKKKLKKKRKTEESME